MDYQSSYNETSFTGQYVDVSTASINDLMISDTLQIGNTKIDEASTTLRTVTIPLSQGDCDFVLTDDTGQIIGGNNTFTGINSFSNVYGILVDQINEYTLNNGVTIEQVNFNDGLITGADLEIGDKVFVDEILPYTLNGPVTINGVSLKDGEITDTSYSTGILHSDSNGQISSSLIIDNDITSNTITFNKINQIATGKVCGNISGSTSNISLLDATSTAVGPSVVLRDSSGDTSINALSTNNIYSRNIYNYAGDNFRIYSVNGNIDIICLNDAFYKITMSNTIFTSGLNTDNIYERTLNNGVNIDGVTLKDGTIFDTSYTGGVLRSDINGNITSGVINVDDISDNTVTLEKLEQINPYKILGNISSIIGNVTEVNISENGYSSRSAVMRDYQSDIQCNNIESYGSVCTPYIQSNQGMLIQNNNDDDMIITNDQGDINIMSDDGNILLQCNNLYQNITFNSFDLFLKCNRLNIEYLRSNSLLRSNSYGQISVGTVSNSDIDNNASILLSKLENISNGVVLGNTMGMTGPIVQLTLSQGSSPGSVCQRDVSGDVISNNLVLSNKGTVGVPAIRFQSDGGTGIFSDALHVLKMSCNGSSILELGTTAVSINSPLSVNTINNTTINTGTINNSAGTISTSKVIAAIGSQTLPSYTYSGDNDTGWYSPTAGEQNAVCNGFIKLNITPSNVNVSSGTFISTDNTLTNISSTIINNSLGTAASPSYTFTGDPNTGIYSDASDVISFATNGIRRARITNTGVQLSNGSEAAPSYSFISDTDTGIYRIGVNNIGISTNATKRLDISDSWISASNYSADGLSYIGGILATGTLTNMTLGDINFDFTGIANTATWTRLFNMVTIFFSITWTGKGSTSSGNQIRIKGLPYNSNATYGGNSITASIAGNPGITISGAGRYLTLSCVAGNNFAVMWIQNSAATDTNVTCGNLGTSGSMFVTLTYSV
jgi:hypothetical protein